jgi:hypothetical protein
MSNTENTRADLEAKALSLVRTKDDLAKALKGTLGYHQAREKSIISESILRGMCEDAGVNFDELLSKYE